MTRKTIASSVIIVLAVALWASYQGTAQQTPSSLARLMPPDAVLYLEAQDLGTLLKEWNASPEKQAWLRSDNFEVFSRSRLVLRLKQAQSEFASAAGIPPDYVFLNDISGEQSALGIYDIGKLELLYVTRLPSARAMNSGIWQQRAKFETRQAAGHTFYVRTDAESERVTAFAFQDDYLILGTREDLVAGTLSLLANANSATLSEQGWFVHALKTAKNAGELRMVIHLAEVTETPQFRTYWAQQNITEMRQYESCVTDLFRSAANYREERALLLKEGAPEPVNDASKEVAEVMRLAPPDMGFYRAAVAPSTNDTLVMLEQKVLTPRLGPAQISRMAPTVQTGEQTAGSQSDLQTRIDVPPAAGGDKAGDDELKELLKSANVRATLELHRSEAASDGVFVRPHSTIVLRSTSDWDASAVRRAIQKLVAPGLTASDIGATWKQAGSGAQAYFEWNVLARIMVATRGKYLVASDDAETMMNVLGRMSAPVSSEPALYYAGFDHGRERQNFYKLTELVDRPNRTSTADAEHQPEFFSGNVASLSKTLARVKSQSMVARRDGAVERQTVVYQWTQ